MERPVAHATANGTNTAATRTMSHMELDPVSGRIAPFLGRERFPGFKGFNDLFFASNGDLYFTDQGLTGLHDPTGRVWRHRAHVQIDMLLRRCAASAAAQGAEESKSVKIGRGASRFHGRVAQ